MSSEAAHKEGLIMSADCKQPFLARGACCAFLAGQERVCHDSTAPFA